MKICNSSIQKFYLEMKNSRYAEKYINHTISNILEFYNYLKEHSIANFGELRKSDILNYYNFIGTRKNLKKAGVLSNGTIRAKISSIRGFYSFLCRSEMIKENPWRSVNIPLRKSDRNKRKAFSTWEITYFLENIITVNKLELRNRTIFELMYSSGVRSCEIVNLCIEDINFEEREIIVRGKFGTERMVPISVIAKSFLLEYLGTRVFGGKGFVFLSKQNKIMAPEYLGYIFKGYLKKFNMYRKGFSVHSVRHTTATHLLERGASIRHVQELLGHKSIGTTEIYTHVKNNDVYKNYVKYHPRQNSIFAKVDNSYIEDINSFVLETFENKRKRAGEQTGQNLKKLRTQRNVSRYELAAFLGVGYTTIAGYENCDIRIRDDRAQKLAEYFGVDKKLFLSRD